MNTFEFSAKLLSKLKTSTTQEVGNDIFNYIYDVMDILEDENPQLYNALLHTREFYGSSMSCYAVCYADYPLKTNPGIFEQLKKSCKSVLKYVGKPHNPNSLLTFSSYGLKVKEMSSSSGNEYCILTTIKSCNCQLTSDIQITKMKADNIVKYEFTITLDKVF